MPALVDTLIDSSDDVRAASARALGKLDDERAVPALMGALGDSDSSVRETSAHALGTIGDSRAAPRLIGSLKDPETGVRRAAVASLLKLDLDEHREEAVTGLIQMMGDSGYTEEVDSLRAEAACVLGELGDRRAVPVLIEALGERYKDEVFRAATQALGDIGDREAVPALVRVLEKRLDRFSVDVVEALGRLGDPRAGQALIDTLDRCGYDYSRDIPWVICSTAEALGRLGVVRAIPHLIAQLHRKGFLEVDTLAWALKQLGDTLAVEVMIDMLESAGSSHRERERAAEVLEVLEDPAAVPALIRALGDEEPTVRGAAVRALGGLRDTRAFEPLVNLLDDEAALVRVSAVSSLGRLGDARAVPHLHAALDDDDRMVRTVAERSLEQLRDSYVPGLLVPRNVLATPPAGRILTDNGRRLMEQGRGAGIPPAQGAARNVAVISTDVPWRTWGRCGIGPSQGGGAPASPSCDSPRLPQVAFSQPAGDDYYPCVPTMITPPLKALNVAREPTPCMVNQLHGCWRQEGPGVRG